MQTCDVLIVGGGMVGSTLACALGGSDLEVVLLEAQPPLKIAQNAPFDLRVSAISLANQRLLANLGVWPALQQSDRICPYTRMRVWEAGGHETLFDCAELDAPALGFFVENRLLQQALLERCTQFDNIQIISPASAEDIRIEADRVTVRCQQQTLRTRLLIGADGSQSRVRQAAAIGTHSWDYEQAALVCTIKSALPQQDITWQRFTAKGPQAFLPLAQCHASLVWYEHPDTIRHLQTLTEQEFLTELEAAFPPELGRIEVLIGRASFPLKRMHAQHYVKPNIALIGDAAHTVHPLAGQGVNMGLLDAAALAEIILNAGSNFAAFNQLRKYERWRKAENLTMLTATDGFYRVFSNTSPVLYGLRNSALLLADKVFPLKQQAMRSAMGIAGRQPQLCGFHPSL